ncbi:DNA topoisomerase 3 [Anaerosinus massiliensis]|uniref:DNA topoisomerase 3 n=1 Tax=Massilibacillus massiliensis TaxID=1806837 RepID=UPI000A939CF3|nr:DNA topoisomerase 3 [Massilibacillus massiliensis]
MRLYIAEKPSMGAEIAKCLTGPIQRKDGYLITKDGVVTWGFGHILRQAEPNEYDSKYQKWRMEDLPIIPQEWKLLIDKSCEKQFYIIKGLIDQATEIVHAGDPDREGQLLIDEVLDYLHNAKPVKRILLNALDEKSIRKAIASLRDNQEFLNLKHSALARARADWLIGMNLSRAYTLAAQRAGHRITLPIGRVKTPTLALVVRRERELKNFVPVDYFTIKVDFAHENGTVTANWKPKDEQIGLDSEGRLLDQKIAEALAQKFAEHETQGGQVALYETAEKKESQRLPFSLSALQVLAGKRFGYEPQQVLDTAQRLYEKKITSYPRSDCDYLPQNQFDDAKIILRNLIEISDAKLAKLAQQADPKIKSRAWNDKKISAHHAIIPTQEKCNLNTLTEVERNIYFLIAQAYIAQFYPIYIYDQTKIELHYKEETFTASGRVMKQLGWKEVYGAEADDKKEEAQEVLPAMSKGDLVEYIKTTIDKKSTKPPTRFTAATLLAAMKEIHKYVKNPELKKKLKDVYGIGTEATRATIIKELMSRGFMVTEAKKKFLVPTDAAYLLIDALPDEVIYPDSTAIWENNLHSMAEGDAELEQFVSEQIGFTKMLCEKANQTSLPLNGEHPCPRCRKGVLQLKNGKNGPFWGCSNFPRCRATCDDENGKPKEMEKLALCPRCKEGSLRLINGKNGSFWGCTNYPSCTATYNDLNGKPNIGTT